MGQDRKNTGLNHQFAFITGPSATADIQAINFKGMHGPVKVFVIFITEE